ncbi:MAG TPA: NAD(P)H-hydrate dehydratase [Cyclobacteriaceae bacterium]|nr:NAD(P)H-hydrate dehydratase [Cyclobacteriaceae bacterium]
MPKILNATQLKEADAYTVLHTPIASIDLMERACQGFVQWFVERYDASKKVGIICGTGNNGGDGLGIARLLSDWGYPVAVWIVRGGTPESEDFRINRKRLREQVKVIDLLTATPIVFADRDVLVDAIFGFGLSRPATGIYGEVITAINDADRPVVAVDVPSGLFIDQPAQQPVVRAKYTVTFQLPKLAFLLPENHAYVGQWTVIDIGISKKFLHEVQVNRFFSGKRNTYRLLKSRNTFDHKGAFGHALIIAGSEGKMGACILASRAALRSGVGLLTAHVPKGGNAIMQQSVPEAMTSIDPEEKCISILPEINIDVIGIGPGLGQSKATLQALRSALQAGKPMVIDADALNLIGQRNELLHLIPAGSILTPHVKEFERIVGTWKYDYDRLNLQLKLARQINGVVLVKGAYTAIATSAGDIFFNNTGNPGMATAGSGDVLTGILTGLLAQGYEAPVAAVLGTYMHGLSGDLAAREKGEHSLIASDLIDYLPHAFREAARGK